MDFLSDKTEVIRSILREIDLPKDSSEMKLYKALVDMVDQIAQQQDLLTNKVDEIEQTIEELSMSIHDLQEVIVRNLDLEPIDKPEQGEDFDEEHIDDFYTLQCPFCEELFFIENDELDQEIPCPVCGKNVKAIDNIVKK